MLHLSYPDCSSPEWEDLTNELRGEVRNLLDLFRKVPGTEDSLNADGRTEGASGG